MNTITPSMNPEVVRIRQQARERKYRKRLRFVRGLWLIAGLLLLLLVIEAMVALCSSPRFWIARMQVRGLDTLTAPEVITLAALPEQTNYFRAPLRRLEANIGVEPRVASVEVSRGAMGTLVIDVRERVPVCRLGSDDPGWYLDATGVLFTRPAPPTTRIPTVTGIKGLDLPSLAGRALDDARAQAALQCLAALRDQAGEHPLPVKRVDVDAHGTVTLVLWTGPRVYLGRGPDFTTRVLVAHGTLQQAIAAGHVPARIQYIDARGAAGQPARRDANGATVATYPGFFKLRDASGASTPAAGATAPAPKATP